MKKRYKGLLMLAGAIAVPAAVNHLIFKHASRPLRTKLKDHYYTWKYGDIRYIIMGEGEPLLLVHGIGAGCSLREWEDCIVYLSKQYKVFAIDLLGFGNSSKPAISYSSYLYTSLINDFIKDVIGKPVYVAGSSDAANFCMLAYSFQPDNFKKILLISPTGVGEEKNDPYPTIFSPKAIKRILESPLLGTTLYNIIASKMSCSAFLREFCYYDETLVSSGRINKYYHAAHTGGVNSKYPVAAFIAGDLHANIESVLGNISIPVHVVWGRENPLAPVSNFNEINDINENISLSEIEETKLLPHSEKPKEFYRICRKFFD